MHVAVCTMYVCLSVTFVDEGAQEALTDMPPRAEEVTFSPLLLSPSLLDLYASCLHTSGT